MRAGVLNKRCAFYRRATVDDGYGNVRGSWALLLTVWGGLKFEADDETLAADRPQAQAFGRLTVRCSTAAKGITAADCVEIDGERWNVQNIAQRDQRGRFLEIKVMRGGAEG